MSVDITQAALERAITNDELVLYYQPKISLITGEIIGAEALVRWSEPEGNILPPGVFLPQVEKAGLLHDVTIKLLDIVVDAITEMRKVKPGLAISMNVAPNDLADNMISRRIQYYLENTSILPSDLQIEITESAAMSNVEQIKEDLCKLSDMGIKVLMDDFGTGYSSIDRLSQLPFSFLKLDQGVVKRMGTSRQNMNVVKSSISMARELRMTSIAEGIESAPVYQFLMANGCEEAQGFYISRPIALKEFIDFVKDDHDFEGSQIGCVHQAIHNVHYQRKCLIDVILCAGTSSGACLPSIIDPDIQQQLLEESRIGLWYYGVGQPLKGIKEFDALDAPVRDLYSLADRIMALEPAVMDQANRQQTLQELDFLSNQIVSGLHSLESALLMKAG